MSHVLTPDFSHRYVLLNVVLNAGEGFVTVKEVTGEDGQPDLLLSVDRSKLISVGKPAVGEFLQKLQVYKSLGDYDTAKAMYDELSEVRDDGRHPFGKWRQIILARKTARKVLVQANTILKDEALTIKDYPASVEGMMASWQDRFSAEENRDIDAALDGITKADAAFFQSTA